MRLLKCSFLTAFLMNFATMCTHMLSKFYRRSVPKYLIFPTKANSARSLLFRIVLVGFFLIQLVGCCPGSASYRAFYAHLHQPRPCVCPMEEEEYFLVILVNARHLDYTDTCSFFHTVAKHPSDGSTTGDLGHAWIYLQGKIGGQTHVLEGGHSGERGRLQARYFDGIMNYNDWGYANPTIAQMQNPRYEPNPVKYLWSTLNDGFFQKGAGGHRPTYAAKVSLTKQQYHLIVNFIRSYPYQFYSLTQQQCSTFVSQVASLADFYVESMTPMTIQPRVYYGGVWVRLWDDPSYACIALATPDLIEKGLMKAVKDGRAEYALDWYLRRNKGQARSSSRMQN